MNGTVQNLKEAWQKMPGKTKKMIAVIAAGTIILAAAGLLVLNIGTKKGYSTLFTGMSSDDAQAVVSLLQDEGVDYRYNDKNGSVQVMSDTVDKTRAELLSKGYPKSGFTYSGQIPACSPVPVSLLLFSGSVPEVYHVLP